MMTYKKKLIEVALPLAAINIAGAKEKTIRHGHPSNLHRWWARRPFVSARAVIFAQMVDDPSEHPEIFKTEKEQEIERLRLFEIIEDLVKWENSSNEDLLIKARNEIKKSWQYTCNEMASYPELKDLYDSNKLPAFHDPFAGGGALPLEAQRLGLESFATDLNPVPIIINKAMIEVPPKFVNKSSINPDARRQKSFGTNHRGYLGLQEDVKFYGAWINEQANKRLSNLYPKYLITDEVISVRPDLEKYRGKKLTVIAWLWARTVKSSNPAFSNIDVPLVSSFLLSSKANKEAYVRPILMGSDYKFEVCIGLPDNLDEVKSGTKLARGANFKCIMSGTPLAGDYIKAQGKLGNIGSRLMAIVAEGDKGRVYLTPNKEHEEAAKNLLPEYRPEVTLSGSTQYLGVKPYGMDRIDQLFTNRQLITLGLFTDLVAEVREVILKDALDAGMADDNKSLEDGGLGARAYADALCLYLAIIISKTTDSNNSLCPWEPVAQCTRQLFGRQAISMMWDYGEANPLHDSSGGLLTNINGSIKAFDNFVIDPKPGKSTLADATSQEISRNKVVSTDPPYYDNVPYADLSDFFYVWLRKSLKPYFPDLFPTVAVPKTDELVAFAYRHENKKAAEGFFLNGMTKAMQRIAEQAHPAFPVTIYYAFKQAESENELGTSSTGWETFLDAVIQAGFAITGTWPMRTEMVAALKAVKNNLATSIVLVCRRKEKRALTVTRRDFITELKKELPPALRHLQEGNIAPVDLAQAAIGPGMAIYSKYAEVIDANGNKLTVKTALSLINEVLDDALMEQEGDFDADTRWAITWFEQYAFGEGDYGIAEQLSISKNTSVSGLVEAGILFTKAGKVKLLKPVDLPEDWNPAEDQRLTVWEMVHHLVRVLETDGESAAALIVKQLGSKAETARELCYRLYNMCERKKRATEAMAYNGLVQSWLEINKLATETPLVISKGTTASIFDQGN